MMNATELLNFVNKKIDEKYKIISLDQIEVRAFDQTKYELNLITDDRTQKINISTEFYKHTEDLRLRFCFVDFDKLKKWNGGIITSETYSSMNVSDFKKFVDMFKKHHNLTSDFYKSIETFTN